MSTEEDLERFVNEMIEEQSRIRSLKGDDDKNE